MKFKVNYFILKIRLLSFISTKVCRDLLKSGKKSKAVSYWKDNS